MTIIRNVSFQGTLLFVLFLLYHYLIFEIGDNFLEKPRLKKGQRLLVGVVNTVVALGVTLAPGSSSLIGYIVIGVLLFLEFYLFYKEMVLRIIALSLTYLIHIMAVRALCVAIYSMATGFTIYTLVNDTKWLVITMNFTLIVINIMLIFVLKMLSVQNASIITEHKEQLVFLISYTGICCLYFFFNAGIYRIHLPISDFSLTNQIAVSITILCGYYVVLIFSILVGRSVYYKEKNAELKVIVQRDSLTGLYNKGATQKHITDFVFQSESAKMSRKGALFLIDVDNFKAINDQFGHTFGDTVLLELSQGLISAFRFDLEEAEEESSGDIIGRIGGDEFMVFIKNTTDHSLLTEKAEKIRKVFTRTYQDTNDNKVSISCSIGIARFPENGVSFERLYRCADIAIYQSKNKGKDTYSFYSGEEFKGYQSRRNKLS